MKKLLLISMLIGAMPLAMMAQDDDLYFVPKKNKVEKVTDNYGLPRETYYSGSDRSIDDYNRKKSSYETIDKDSLIDVVDFSAEQGVYPDSVSEDFELTKRMSRFDDYDLSDNAAFWAGYSAGRSDWAWHSPWYYSRFGWYGGWYDPWYFGNWRYGWYDPWYYGYAGWYGGWYDPWYYGYYGSWRYGWYDPWFYGPSWYGYGIGASRPHVATIGHGTIRRNGYEYNGGHSAFGSNSTRMTTLRNRNVSGHSRYGGNRSSGTYSGSNSRSSDYNRSSSFGSSRSSSGSYGSSSGSRGGGFSGGASRGGGGGSSRMGGRR